MHNNYHFLRKLVDELTPVLQGSVISECFSQNKDELIIRFETSKGPFYIKASLLPAFSCLSFPSEFNRARKNSVDLFSNCIGQQVETIRSFKNERCFSIALSNEYELLFKMHGNRANVVLFFDKKSISLFRNHQHADLEIDLSQLDKEIELQESVFGTDSTALQKHFFTFGKIIWKYLEVTGFQNLSPDKKYEAITQLLKQLDNPSYYITQVEHQLILSLVPVGEIKATFSNAVDCLNEFFHQHAITAGLVEEKQKVLSKLHTLVKNGESYLTKTRKKLSEIQSDDHYKIWADLIMANLHMIKPGMDKITLPDFYHENKPMEVKLKKDLNAQKNAEIYYRKAKNHHIEVSKLTESVLKKEAELNKLNAAVKEIADAQDLKTLRNLISDLGFSRKGEKKEISLPYREIEFKGFRIYIGKNAKNNDELTLKHTYKEDLWLHAKDVSGSHVVIKHQSGKNFPTDVIERAAQLAAHYSKRSTESLCPVIITTKKFVRKRKGDPPGTVVVEKERVIMVEPKP